MVRCTFCDLNNPPTALRCTGCGAELPGAHERSQTAVEPQPASRAPIPDDLQAEILSLLRAGRKIEAIKAYRERTNAGLAEAKQAVEALGAAHGITTPQSGCAGVLLVLLALACVLVLALA